MTTTITNNVVDGGVAFRVPAHLSLGQHIIDCFRENAKEDKVALIHGDDGHKIMYSEILQKTVDVAVGFKKAGVRRGYTVAVCGENSFEYIIAAMGAICCGATLTPMNPLNPKDEMDHALRLSKPQIVCASQEVLKVHMKSFKCCVGVDKIVQLDGSKPVESSVTLLSQLAVTGSDVSLYEPTPVQGYSDPVLLLYSSGTTGLPKGVMLTHVNYLYSVIMFEKQNIPKTLLSILPWYHAYGLMTVINLLILDKLVVYFSGLFNPPKYLQAIQEHKVGVLLTVPPIIVFLSKAPMVEQYDLSSVKMVWCGAAPLSIDVIQAALKRMPNCVAIFQGYGMTESSLLITMATPNKVFMPGSSGVPIPGVKVKVVDIKTRKRLGPNQTGEVCIKGPVVMKGYIDNEKATRDIIDEEGFMKTGDVGYYDREGRFYMLDRLREFIKYKGHEVAPAVVESVLLQHAGVAECGVVGAPDDRAGELPTAFVVPKPGNTLSEKDLLEFADSRLSAKERLEGGVIIVDEIPKTHSGKILRRLLKEKLLERADRTKM